MNLSQILCSCPSRAEPTRVFFAENRTDESIRPGHHQATISLEMVRGVLTEMHGTLTDCCLGAKRAALSKVVHKVVMGATGAELVCTFSLGE